MSLLYTTLVYDQGHCPAFPIDSSDSDHLRVPETLRSTSYSEPLPAVPNNTACSFHSDPSPDILSDGFSETSASSEGNLETSSDSAPSDLKSGPMFFRNSLSHSGDRVAPAASNIKGRVIKVIHNVKGQWWSGCRRYPRSELEGLRDVFGVENRLSPDITPPLACCVLEVREIREWKATE